MLGHHITKLIEWERAELQKARALIDSEKTTFHETRIAALQARYPQFFAVVAALLLMLAARAAHACYPCSYWQTWGQRAQVCSSPSEGLLDDALFCWCAGACAGPCSAWCASYDFCESTGLSSCQPTGATQACESCLYTSCGMVTNACSDDTTGCAYSCFAWLSGSPVCDVVTQEELDLSDCACAGNCADKCGGSCGLGYFDTTGTVSMGCQQCLGKAKGCGSAYGACLSN